MKRIIQAVFAAIIINAVLASGIDHLFHITGVYPPYGEPMMDDGLMALAYSYRVIIMIAAAYVAAMIAKEKAKQAVWISASIGTLMWTLGAIAMWNFGPVWYHIIGIVTIIPLNLLGWKLYERRAKNSVE